MAWGLFCRPRSKKRCAVYAAAAFMFWMYTPGLSSPKFSPIEYFSRPAAFSQMLDHFDKPLCPSFRSYDRQKLLLLDPNECTPLLSEHPDFSVDICFSPYVCNEGLVRVRRRDRALCKEANLMYPIMNNATHEASHRQLSGPDSFYVVFNGAEKLAPPDWYHAGQCLYVFPFHISNPGKLTLDITHLYDNFGAVLEERNGWPILRRRKVLSSVPIEICKGCSSRTAPPRFPLTLSSEDTLDGSEEDTREGSSGSMRLRHRLGFVSTKSDAALNIPPTEDLPLCSRQLPIQGAWLPAHPSDKGSWRRANYTWTPLGCRLEKPLDLQCILKKSGSKILFQGDTQLRVALEHLLRRLNGTETLQTSTSPSSDRFEEKFGSTTFKYVHDPLFRQLTEKPDILVANMGHWATGTKFLDHLWSTAKYNNKLEEIVQSIRQRARDLQDLEDEDEDEDDRYRDGEYGAVSDDDDSDEDDEGAEGDKDAEDVDDEWEKEQEAQRQRDDRDKEGFNKNVYWDDEAEEKEEERSNRRPPPSYPGLNDESGMRRGGSNRRAGRGRLQEGIVRQAKNIGTHESMKEGGAEPILRQKINGHGGSKKGSSGVNKFQSTKGSKPTSSRSGRTPQSSEPSAASRYMGLINDDDDDAESTTNSKKQDQYNDRGQKIPNPQRQRSSDSDRSNSNQRESLQRRSLSRADEEKRRKGLAVKGIKLAWVGMLAYPETQPADAFMSHDWRTIYRLRYWNQIAEEVMLLNNVRFMDFFSMTLSMLDTSPDRSHYFGTDAAEAMLEELQFKLELCNEEVEIEEES
ncbi:hypothetical protein BGW38_009710 [Lunasporangiospora selenospora]|uniref:Uncharacterized protein n=1 Tax=Lunasporangiospora selenospora TaxID=979761 RepID=A0A9P6G236_9FUNG|nr:hypothetical protein BGW38_009710 [Lunasporangiospora selenospora]